MQDVPPGVALDNPRVQEEFARRTAHLSDLRNAIQKLQLDAQFFERELRAHEFAVRDAAQGLHDAQARVECVNTEHRDKALKVQAIQQRIVELKAIYQNLANPMTQRF
jgi:chromosome segregation ATPase